ncbi:Gll2956 protein [Candidatus Vecturithrix granuli]|uniref:Gll2956 protein n=1 Tax=Vecturithrix granuli TaxID=1499967 RepID=A0A081C5X4_VECG1|nr:Gll2956 protein [Candidatus Vecturithrix granuli]
MNSKQIISTEHPYIIKAVAICGGRPIIKGTRTPVQAIVEYYRLGMDAYQILTELPHITEAQLHDALSYFYDHKEEIETGIGADHQIIRQHQKETTRCEVVTAS